MNDRVLFVDDEINVLNAYKRSLRKEFHMDTAISGVEALEMLAAAEPYAVLVSDMRMPGMDGVQVLSKAREVAPNTVRIMLTGNADQQTAVDAVNQGDIFRFLTKPCAPAELAHSIHAGMEQHRLVMAEKELLEETLKGSVRALTEALSLVNPAAFGRTERIKELVSRVGLEMKLPNIWALETLAMLSQLGCIIVPDEVLRKLYQGGTLNEEERQIYEMHPTMGAELITGIPRMERFADAMRYQLKNFDGSGVPHDERKGKDLPAGARILRVVLDFDDRLVSGLDETKALVALNLHKQLYDPVVLAALDRLVRKPEPMPDVRKLGLDGLRVGMRLAADVCSIDDTLVVANGQEVTPALLQHMRRFSGNQALKQPFMVFAGRPATETR